PGGDASTIPEGLIAFRGAEPPDTAAGGQQRTRVLLLASGRRGGNANEEIAVAVQYDGVRRNRAARQTDDDGVDALPRSERVALESESEDLVRGGRVKRRVTGHRQDRK